MQLARPEPCPAHRTLTEVVAASGSAETLLAIQAHAAECAECKRIAPRLLVVARGVEAAASQTGDRPIEAGTRDWSFAPLAQRYELGREIARGGMGRIHEAWDRTHERRVAIKLLLRSGGDSIRRFAREASITARLQHPAIVAVYDTGSLPSGEPFFAMKLVDGRSLGDLVADTPLLGARLALVPQLVAVCDALAYAHDQGIVHRDLKPSNVLVGPFGEAVVIDWGLAKVLRADVDRDARTLDPDAPLADAPLEDDAPRLTVEGAMLGTPSYMAPEQAAGNDVDARTDIYALGALLYHVLAGAPPYPGSSPLAVVESVRSGPPAPLASLVPELAVDVVAIVEKAMARDPAQRYASAAELAKDLRRLEAGQLVSAHSYSFTALLARWAARHRTALATAAVMLVALLVTGAVSVRRILHERDRADAARAVAEHERLAAVTQRDAAEKVVEFMIGELRTRLQPLGKLDLLAGVGAKVADYYRSVSASGAEGDVATLRRHAASLDTLAFVEQGKQNFPEAIALQRQANALRERVVELAPGDAKAKCDLGSDLAVISGMHLGVSDRDSAGAALTRALALVSEAVAADGTNASYQAALGWVHAKRGLMAHAVLDKAATGEYERAIAAYERATALDPASTEHKLDLAWVHTNLGNAIMDDDIEASAKDRGACLDIMRGLLRSAPDNTRWQHQAAWCQWGLGHAEAYGGNVDAALADLRASTKVRDALRKGDPENADWQREYANSLEITCDVLGLMARFDEAQRACAEAWAIYADLAQKAPDVADGPTDMASELQTSAQVELSRKDGGRALGLLARAIALTPAASPDGGGDDGAESKRLAGLHADSARAEVLLGHAGAALDHARAALDLLAKSQPPARDLIAEVRRSMGEALAARGDGTAAEESYRASIALDTELERTSTSRAPRLSRARTLRRLGELLAKAPARRAEARAALTDATAILARFATEGRLAPVERAEWAQMAAELRALPTH
jgi:tetratricopeptide (TPR) repeat protein